jgi:peptidoglycan/LPS O-acetylase OafA/YrhL
VRLIGIDMLRGIAVTLVIFRHFDFIDLLGRFGWAGVDLFFVLSGFLVSGLLFKEYQKFGNIKPWLFLIRRGFKIYPLFYTLMAVTWLKAILVSIFNLQGNLNFSTKTFLAELFFVQNYFDRIWKHTWSLAIEEHFYLLLTLLIFLLVRYKQLENRNLFNAFSIFLFVATLGLRLYNATINNFSYDSHIFPSHLRFDSLFFGVFLAYNYYFNKDTFLDIFHKHRQSFRILAVLFVLPGFIWEIQSFFMSTVGLTLLYLGFGLILIDVFLHEQYFLKFHWAISPLSKFFAFVGFYSYSIYLWHIPVKVYILKTINNYIGLDWPISIQFIFYFSLCLFVGYFFSRLIEVPMLRFRDTKYARRRISI